MTELKVGDRVRLSTGVEGVVDRVEGHGSFGVDFGDAGYYNSRDLEALNISWELIEPVLFEPPVGSVISFFSDSIKRKIFAEHRDGEWHTEDSRWTDWARLAGYHEFTEYELLRPEKEVVKEALKKVLRNEHDGDGDFYDAIKTVAEEYGVEL